MGSTENSCYRRRCSVVVICLICDYFVEGNMFCRRYTVVRTGRERFHLSAKSRTALFSKAIGG